ncbi:Uncharacterised protein [Acinetobacter baumannii]|nr:Uncharacterised protein [Acinetobacter baumannii]SVL53405.1 Uncharacterised protein [Klebsiella pneumoniae]
MCLFLKLIKNLFIITMNPAYRIYTYWLINTVNFIFFFQAVSNNVKLKYTHSSHDQIIANLWHKYLSCTFFRQLFQTFLQLF